MTTASDAPDSAEITVQDDLAVRKTLGPYELKKKLGQGGMGAVYLAVNPAKKMQVAIKVLPREKAANPQLVKRFKAEAQNAAQLQHDNIVGVFETGEADGYLYIALEFVDGIDVYDLIQKRGVLPVKRSIDIIKQVSRALQHAHEQHIVHRDIKPANLLIRRDGVVKLADMGLARAVDESIETGITRAGTTVGTVDYMSPEQARNSKSADVRSDIYSLGCTWYHMLAGTPPFAEGSLTNKLHAHAKMAPPDPRDENPNVPEGVVAVMHRMMAKDPDERYQTPQELIKDLEGALINKEAVSRKILEGIVEQESDDDVDQGDSTYAVADPLPLKSRNPGRSKATTDSSTDDDYAAIPESSEVERANESHDELNGEPHDESTERSHSASSRKPGDQSTRQNPNKQDPSKQDSRAKGGASTATNTRQPTDEQPEDESGDPNLTLIPGKSPALGTARPGHAAKQTKDTRVHTHTDPANTDNANSATGKQGTAKQASTTSRPIAKSVKTEVTGGPRIPSHSLPPPKRKTEGDSAAGPAIPMSPKKLATIAGGIIALLILLSVVFPIIKKNLVGEEPLVVGVNPLEGAPPPPVPPAVPVNAVPVPAEGPNAPGAQQTVKDVLVERQDLLANSNPVTTGSRPGGTAGAELAVPDNQQRAQEWMDQPLQTAASPIFSIRKGQTVDSERQYPALQDALQKVSKEGGRLVLFHDGPFDLAPFELNGGIVSIEAAVGVRPRVRLIQGPENKAPGIVVNDGSLVLDGVDIVCDATAAPADQMWTWFHVQNGHIYVKRSSLTMIGQRKGPTVAFRQSGKPGSGSSDYRFLLDDSVVRGAGLQAASLENPSFESVMRNSLVISGQATGLTLLNPPKATADANRSMRFVRTTLSTQLQGLALLTPEGSVPVSTQISLEDSLFATPDDETPSILLQMSDWPAAKPRVGDASPFRNLTWKSTNSAALGFAKLVDCKADVGGPINDAGAWKQLWREPGSGIVFSSSHWPKSENKMLAQADLKIWSLKTLEELPVVFANPDEHPGCKLANLRAPDLSGPDQALASRVPRPRTPGPFIAKAFQQVDLTKTDLGKLIGSKPWDDGTVIVVNGQGSRTCSPIVIDGRRIRIQFNQIDALPFVIYPKAGPRSGEHGAFITVRNGGHLDLENGTFVFDPKDGPSITPWFMNVEGGSFALRKCRITAPVVIAGKNKGLIRWVSTPASSAKKGDGEFSTTGQIIDTRLVGNGMLVSMEAANMALISKNSAFISRQSVLDISRATTPTEAASVIDAENCTYLASGTQFVIHGNTMGMRPLPPIRVFHQDCVFATLQPDTAGKSVPLLMNLVGATDTAGLVDWGEESCGYAMELKAFFLASPTVSTGLVAPQDFSEQWLKKWGEKQIQRPLRTLDGVLFDKNLTHAATLIKPENLALHKSAKARTWSETGGAIGVKPEALEPAPAVPRPAPGIKKPGNNTPNSGLKL